MQARRGEELSLVMTLTRLQLRLTGRAGRQWAGHGEHVERKAIEGKHISSLDFLPRVCSVIDFLV